jgi:flagellar protein FlgJ
MKMDTQVAQTIVNNNSLHELRYAASKDRNDKETLKQVAAQFESLFVSMMLKSMRDAQLSEGLFDSDQSRMYQDMADQQLALDMSQNGGLGLQNVILRQLGGDEFVDSQMAPTSNNTPVGHRYASPVNSPINQTSLQPTLERISEQSPSAHLTVGKPPSEISFNTPQQFVENLWPYAKQAGDRLGVEPEVILAQAALETGWGKHVIKHADGNSTHNLFNIKADKRWQGDHAQLGTMEYRNGQMLKEPAKFRSYDSFQQSFDDYVNFLQQNPRYQDALKQTDDSEQFIEAIHDAGYATDPAYADKIKRILNSDTMAQFSQSTDYTS